MEKNNLIEIKELLRKCPKGMPLDSDLSDNVTFVEVLDCAFVRPVVVNIEGNYLQTLDAYGCIYPYKGGKCVIWPVGKRTWEDFVPPMDRKESIRQKIHRIDAQIEELSSVRSELIECLFTENDKKEPL